MTPELPVPPPVDGIVSPASEKPVSAPVSSPVTPAAPLSPPRKKAGLNFAFILFVMFALAYAFPALVAMVVFPTPDGSLASVKQVATLVYTIGLISWLGFGIAGFLRIAAVKDHPRMRFFASARLAAFVLPLTILSGAVLFFINTAPKLRLEILSPSSADQLIAPVSIVFGMETPLKLFRQMKLAPLKYSWDFNNDGIVDQETFDPTSTYLISKAGIFNVVCTVSMTNGERKQVVYRLVIPRASFAVNPVSPIIDEQATFSIENFFPKGGDANSPKLQKARWDFDGDGVVDLETTQTVASYTFHKLGTVNVGVSWTQTNQTQSSLQRLIEVVKPPEQPFPITLETEPATLLGPPPFGVLFTLKTKEPIANASWDFGNQKNAEGLRVAQVFNAVGSYTVNVTVRSQTGAVARLSKLVRVTNPLDIPDLSFDGSPDVRGFTVEGQVPLDVTMTPLTSRPLISFTWDVPAGTESEISDKTLHAIYRDQGKYYVDLIGVDPDQNVFRKRVTINALAPQSTVVFSMDPETPTAPALVKFDASDSFVPAGEDITGFEWSFNDGAIGGSKFSGARIQHQFERPGTYDISLNIRTTAGQVYSGHQTLVVRAPLFDACFVPSRNSGKAPFGVRFDSGCSTGRFSSWLWDFGDNAQSDTAIPTHVFTKPGIYTVTLTATTPDGLKNTKTAIITVTE